MGIKLDQRSRRLRRQIIEVLHQGKRGHLGASLSLVEIIRVLYDDILHYDPSQPQWPERDRCILSKGHGCIALYVILAEKGFFPTEELWKFCHHNGLLGGHPDATKIPGIEASTGSLGHGLPIAIGMALALKAEQKKPKVYAILGDGECNEGSVWEAAMSAAKHQMDNLVVMIDYNKYQSYDETSIVQELEPFVDKWQSFGFDVHEVNGHDVTELRNILKRLPMEAAKPSVVICHTVKGKGLDFAENNLAWHHKSNIDREMVGQMLKALEE